MIRAVYGWWGDPALAWSELSWWLRRYSWRCSLT